MDAFNLDGNTPLLMALSNYLIQYYTTTSEFLYTLISYGADVRLKNLHSLVTVLHLTAQIAVGKDGLALMRALLDRCTYIHTHIYLCIHTYITYLYTCINMYA